MGYFITGYFSRNGEDIRFQTTIGIQVWHMAEMSKEGRT